jgi:hypothetical protein
MSNRPQAFGLRAVVLFAHAAAIRAYHGAARVRLPLPATRRRNQLTTEIRNCYSVGGMITSRPTPQIQIWSIERLVFYARNPRKNDAVVDRMCSSIREFGFKIPVLARSDGEDEWSAAQVKAFRLMVNRSVTWGDWDKELLALEFQELNEADFDLSLTGFDPKELDDVLLGRRTMRKPTLFRPA